MAWKLTPQTHEVYPRNPLIAVIADLRFHPILKVADRVADFQDRVRAAYPLFQESNQQLINLQPMGAVQVRQDRVFSFHAEDRQATLTLATAAIILESRAHQKRDEVFRGAQLAVEALHDVYGAVSPTRLGLRYVNVVDKTTISRDLGKPVDWGSLITKQFLAVPGGMTDEADSSFFAEITAPVVDAGAMTLRYGRLKDAKDNREKYQFDVDRYLNGAFEVKQTTTLLESFSNDIFCLFKAAQGPDLEGWMRSEGAT